MNSMPPDAVVYVTPNGVRTHPRRDCPHLQESDNVRPTRFGEDDRPLCRGDVCYLARRPVDARM